MSACVRIVDLYPDLLGLYGDRGNVAVLERRCAWREIDVVVERVRADQTPDFGHADLVVLGGGGDRETSMVATRLATCADALRAFVNDGGALLAVGGSFETLGRSLVLESGRIEGLGILDMECDRGKERLTGNVLLESDLVKDPVVGYENHAGRAHLGADCLPLGRVVCGAGNDGASGMEGAVRGSVMGSYLHGPLLPKNPGLADWLLAHALAHAGLPADALCELDDDVERAANAVMARRMRSEQA